MRQVVERITCRAAARADVVGVLLVGSYARAAARPDSDVDLVVLTTAPADYADGSWAGDLRLGPRVSVQARGAVVEHRFVPADGLEVEINIGSPSWARADPVDPGTHRVVHDGAVVLHDPTGILARLLDACRD